MKRINLQNVKDKKIELDPVHLPPTLRANFHVKRNYIPQTINLDGYSHMPSPLVKPYSNARWRNYIDHASSQRCSEAKKSLVMGHSQQWANQKNLQLAQTTYNINSSADQYHRNSPISKNNQRTISCTDNLKPDGEVKIKDAFFQTATSSFGPPDPILNSRNRRTITFDTGLATNHTLATPKKQRDLSPTSYFVAPANYM